jgi:hypothetical protein
MIATRAVARDAEAVLATAGELGVPEGLLARAIAGSSQDGGGWTGLLPAGVARRWKPAWPAARIWDCTARIISAAANMGR